MANDIESNYDSTLVGTKEITSSPNVKPAPPSVNRPIPVPSIYVDERGQIHNLEVGKKRINLLYTRKGVMRSGDLHKNVQHDFIFSGRVEVWRLSKSNGTTKTIYHANEYLKIDPYVPHIFHFVEDTVMAEWWEPPGFYAWFYEPYRRLVQGSFKTTRPGRLQLLATYSTGTRSSDNERVFESMLFMTVGGVVLGMFVGYLVGRKRS